MGSLKLTIKVIGLFLCFSLEIMIFVSCQTTPEKDAVINQAQDYLLGKAETPFSPYSAPERVDYTKTKNGLILRFEADVTIPEVSGYSVQEVKRTIFKESEHLNMIKYFLPEAELLEQPASTQADILARIARVYEIWPEGSQEAEERVAQLQEELKSAPTEATRVPLDITKTPEGEQYYAYVEKESGGYSVVHGKMNGSDFFYLRDSNLNIYAQSMLISDEAIWLLYQADYEGTVPVTCEASEQIALQSVHELGFRDMNVTGRERFCGYDELGRLITKGWYFFITHDNNGLPIYYSYDEWRIAGESALPTLSAPWGQEILTVSVDEHGICSFSARDTCSITKKLYNNVPLLPFDELLERIERQLVYQHVYAASVTKNPRLVIQKIRLLSALVNVADEQDYGRLIPVWEVQYSLAYEYGDKNETITQILSTMFNAIDGSYIEPRISANTLSEIATEREKGS